MSGFGIVRKTDYLGRIVIPKEIRREFGIDIGDKIEIFVDRDKVHLKKYIKSKNCILCSSDEGLIPYKGTFVCKACAEGLGGLC